MEITEDSLFECVDDKRRGGTPRDASKKIKTIKEWRSWMHILAWSYAKSDNYHEQIDIVSPKQIVEMLKKEYHLDMSEPGEVEKKQGILRLAKNAYKDNILKSFKEQIEDYRLGKTTSGELLIIEDNPNKWNIEGIDFENKFVVIKQSFINKILEDHEIDFDLLVDVSNLIQNRILSFESISYPNSRVVILDAKDKYDRDILVALHLDIEKNKIQVSELSSIYGKKELGFLLENTIKLNKQIEITPKTNKWLLSSGVPFPTLVTTYLQNEYNKKFNQSQMEVPHIPDNQELSVEEINKWLKGHNFHLESDDFVSYWLKEIGDEGITLGNTAISIENSKITKEEILEGLNNVLTEVRGEQWVDDIINENHYSPSFAIQEQQEYDGRLEDLIENFDEKFVKCMAEYHAKEQNPSVDLGHGRERVETKRPEGVSDEMESPGLGKKQDIK